MQSRFKLLFITLILSFTPVTLDLLHNDDLNDYDQYKYDEHETHYEYEDPDVNLVKTVWTQQPIVTETEHFVGDTFNITCNVTKFSSLPVIPGQDYLKELSLWRQTFTQSTDQLLAAYTPFAPIKLISRLPSQWILKYHGGEGNTNRQTIGVIVTAVNFQCSDAGHYHCRATLPTDEMCSNKPDTINAKAQLSELDLSVKLQEKNSQDMSSNLSRIYIAISCKVTGPLHLQISWAYSTQDSPNELTPLDQINYTTPAPTQSDNCMPHTYTSVLEHQRIEIGNTYLCIVSDYGVEQSRKNISITFPLLTTLSTDKPNTATTDSSFDWKSFGAGIGAMALILVIVIVALVYCFKYKSTRPKKQHQHQYNIPYIFDEYFSNYENKTGDVNRAPNYENAGIGQQPEPNSLYETVGDNLHNQA